MDTQQIAQILMNLRLMESSEEAYAFDSAVGQVELPLSREDVSVLLRVFDDQTHHFEVMWTLLHCVENASSDLFIDGLLQEADWMLARAPDWLSTFQVRCLNAPDCRALYQEKAAQLDDDLRIRLRRNLDEATKWNPKLGSIADDIFGLE